MFTIFFRETVLLLLKSSYKTDKSKISGPFSRNEVGMFEKKLGIKLCVPFLCTYLFEALFGFGL